MERKDFISKLGLGLAAVCTGCAFASCGSAPKSDDPKPNSNGPIGSGQQVMSVNLATDLKNAGEFQVTSGVILVRLKAGNTPDAFTAVQVACTHQGTSINYNLGQAKFICPNHGSQFGDNGSVLLGPATLPLRQYNIQINSSSLIVTS
jgi:cytochrome b6-f complex iron-sulfur subunit